MADFSSLCLNRPAGNVTTFQVNNSVVMFITENVVKTILKCRFNLFILFINLFILKRSEYENNIVTKY